MYVLGKDDYDDVVRPICGAYGILLQSSKGSPRPPTGLAILYAKLGLQHYNLLRATNLQFSSIDTYSKSVGSAASTYFITLIAKHPTTSEELTFLTTVGENHFGKLDLQFSVATPQGTESAIKSCDYEPLDDFYKGSLPEWPPESDFNDIKRFYVLKESDLQDNNWIRLYLELAVATTDRTTPDHDLSDLKILEVAIETKEDVQPPGERLKEKNAIIYIRYHGKPRRRNPADCIAIVRRTFHMENGQGHCRLLGKILSAENIPKMAEDQSLPVVCRPPTGLAILYAKLGLQHYNLPQGTNLEFSSIDNYSKTIGSAARTYFITLIAKDPTTSEELTFLTTVCENSFGELDLKFSVDRPQGTELAIKSCDYEPVDDFYKGSLPEWPPESDFNDIKRFYVVKKSELQDNDWIRLYLLLAVATTDRSTPEHDLSDLKILEVAIETKEDVQPPSERLKEKNAIIYIRYHGKHPADCIAIVRRTFHGKNGYGHFCLLGKILSAENIPKMAEDQSLPVVCSRRLLGVRKGPSFYFIKKRKGPSFKNNGLSFARHVKRQGNRIHAHRFACLVKRSIWKRRPDK